MEYPRDDLAALLLDTLRVLPLLLEHLTELRVDVEGKLPPLGVLRRAHVEARVLADYARVHVA